ncbi:MAG: DinB family protein [Bacteroidota bacterium]
MKKLIFLLLLSFTGFSQEKLWTETDRKYTLDNLKRTRDELVKETENLSPAQWKFKESPDRWSIAEIVEHLGNWEIIWAREISVSSRNKPNPDLIKTSKPDSYYHEFIMEDKVHDSPTISRPTGFIEGINNLSRFVKLRNENIDFTEKTKADMRALFEFEGTDNPRNMHQVYIYQWGHVDRHMKQIKKVKSHMNYPK